MELCWMHSFPLKRARDGPRFGFVRMSTRPDALCMIQRLDRFWLSGSRITVSLVKRGIKYSFWRHKWRQSFFPIVQCHRNTNDDVLKDDHRVRRRVIRVMDGEKIDVLNTCAVG
ncbi:hypothetical protein V6N13_025713 [Hibiscus sabdariffa]